MKKIALIGHSASGKSSTLETLGLDLALADMDVSVSGRHCAEIEHALAWILRPEAPPIVSVSNFIELMWHLQSAKRKGHYREDLERIYWVYLRKPRKRLANHLEHPSRSGGQRHEEERRTVVREYGRFSKHFNVLADHIIDCAHLSLDETARQVRHIASVVNSGFELQLPDSSGAMPGNRPALPGTFTGNRRP